jgi:hypothetical protein
MLTCESAESLMVREADGAVSEEERGLLEQHAADCRGCRERRVANLDVKGLLAWRVDADVPPAFTARVLRRAAPETPERLLADVDWRRWTEWMLPIAAGLTLIAVLAGAASQGVPAESFGDETSVESAGAGTADDELTTGAQALSQDVTSEELLAAMLGAAPGGAEGTTSHGR